MISNSSRVFSNTNLESNSPPNTSYSPLMYYPPKKRLDRWHVCPSFLNGKCANSESECELAHPTPGKEVKEGIVTICMDHVNEQCKRPNCKYLHPPQHICDQIHDHKKKPPLGLRPRSLSNSSDRDLPELTNSTEDFFHTQMQFPYPFNFYYPNPHPNAVFFPPFSRPPLNMPGQGIGGSFPYQNAEFQFPPGVQDSGGTKYRSKLSRSTSYSGVPNLHSSILPSYHNQLTSASEFSPQGLRIKFPSSHSSSLPSQTTNTLHANLITISVDDDPTDTSTPRTSS